MGNCFKTDIHYINKIKVMNFSSMFKKHGRNFLLDYDIQAVYINLGEFDLYPEIKIKGFPNIHSGLYDYSGNVKIFYFRTREYKDAFRL